jgi:hypothetical protein
MLVTPLKEPLKQSSHHSKLNTIKHIKEIKQEKKKSKSKNRTRTRRTRTIRKRTKKVTPLS